MPPVHEDHISMMVKAKDVNVGDYVIINGHACRVTEIKKYH